MIRPLSLSLIAVAALCHAAEKFPVAHTDPITVRIVSGKNGQPLSNLHLVLVGGYDRSDMHDQLYREEVLTDPFGKVRLSNQLANLPWLQVWVSKYPLCQSDPRKASFSVELMRRDGLSAPNLCGPVTAQIAPGTFTVFVKNRAKKLKNGTSIDVEMPSASAPSVAQAPAPQEIPAAKPAPVVSSLVAAPPAVVVAALPAAPAEAPADAAPKAEPIALAPLPIFPASSRSPVLLTKSVAHSRARRVAAKRITHRAKPVLASCAVQPPEAKAAPKPASTKSVTKPDAKPAAKSEAKPAPPAKDESKKQEENAPVSVTHHSKPLAGRRIALKTLAPPPPPQKQD
jgi:hypothetical protein